MFTINFSRSIALTTLILISACGGGGGEVTASGPITSIETFQFRAGYVNYIKESRSLPFTVTGTSSGSIVKGSGTATQGAIGDTIFESKQAQQKTTTVTGSLTTNGTTIPLSSASTTFFDSNYNFLGSNGSEYAVVNNNVTIPVTARVNDTGTLYSTVRYASSAKEATKGTETFTYVLEPDTTATALLKIIIAERDTSNTLTSTSTITFRMTPAGDLTRISETSLQGPTSLTLNY
jgi:hypothetical protein